MSLSPLPRLTLKELRFDKTIKAIIIEPIQTVLDLALFFLQASNRILSEPFLVSLALMQGIDDSIHNLIVKDQNFE